MNTNVLISTAMLNALWEKKQKDTLDLLLPFLKYTIAKTIKIGEKIDLDTISQVFIAEYGYDTMPKGIVITMLNRLCPKVLKRENNVYSLIANLDEECLAFERKKAQYTEQCRIVVSALQEYLNESLVGQRFDEQSTLRYLIDFFVAEGICIVKDIKMIEVLRAKDNRINYTIAQFIIKEQKEDSLVFQYILQMVNGFFVSTAISFQPTNSNLIKAKYKNLSCYLDTRIILCALGLHLKEDAKTAQELIQMIAKENGTIKCFEHTVNEIYDIINAYKANLQNPHSNRSVHTLETWDELNYTVSDVENYLLFLRKRIESLGIIIEPKPSYNNECPIDEKALYKYLDENIPYRNKEGLAKDVDSVSAVFRMRAGVYSREIERCRAVFITTNIKLAHFSNCFLSNDIKDNFPSIITDVTMASITWLKSFSTNKDYPQKKLIAHALISMEPSPELVLSFLEKIDIIEQSGAITHDEAAIIRSDIFCRREAARAAMGDPDAISDKTIFDIRDRLKEEYLGSEKETASIYQEKYRTALEQKNLPIRKALNDIENSIEKAKKASKILFFTIVSIVGASLLAVCVINLYNGIMKDPPNSVSSWILSSISGGFELLGIIDLLKNQKSILRKSCNKLSFWVASCVGDRKKQFYQNLFPDFNLSDPE